jgi:hypothetical protein
MSNETISLCDIRCSSVGCWVQGWRGSGLGSLREDAFKESGEASGWELARKDRRLLDSANRRMLASKQQKNEQTMTV